MAFQTQTTLSMQPDPTAPYGSGEWRLNQALLPDLVVGVPLAISSAEGGQGAIAWITRVAASGPE